MVVLNDDQCIITAIVVNVKRLANVIDSVCYLKM